MNDSNAPSGFIYRELSPEDQIRRIQSILLKKLNGHSLKYRNITNEDLEDMVQKKLAHMMRYLQDLDQQNPLSEARLNSILYVTAERLIIDHHRRVTRRKEVPIMVETETGEYSLKDNVDFNHEQRQRYDEEEKENRQVRLAQIREAMKDLQPEDRDLLTEVYLNERPIQELAEEELRNHPTVQRGQRAGQPKTIMEARQAVDQRLTRARMRLKERIATLGRDA